MAEAFSPALLKEKVEMGARSPLLVFVGGMPRSGRALTELEARLHLLTARQLRALHAPSGNIEGFPESSAALLGAQPKALVEAYLPHVMAAGRPHVVDKMPSNFPAVWVDPARPAKGEDHRQPGRSGRHCLLLHETVRGRVASAASSCPARDLMARLRATLPASYFLEVDYDAVVDDVQGQAQRRLELLGLPWTEKC